MPTEQPKSNRAIIIGLIVVLLIAAGGWWYYQNTYGFSYELAQGESVQKWDFQGAYKGNSELEKKARDEITRLEGLFGTGDPTDYSLYISIANQFDLLGDGESEYQYLMKALAIDDTMTGLAWHNLANLLARLGAPQSAKDAYARAASAQPEFAQYQSAYLEFLTENFKDNTAEIEKTFQNARISIGETGTLLEIEARWFESVGKIQEAIQVWNTIKKLSPAAASAVDLEIQRLQSQL